MGCMGCARCDSVMCDTYIDDFGYICYNCKQKFENFLFSKGYNPYEIKVSELMKMLKEFKNTNDNEINNSVTSLYEFWSDNTN
jgi:hypothetical protein